MLLLRQCKLNRHLIARDADVLARGFGLPAAAESEDFFMVEESGIGREFPFSGEKLSLVLTVYRAKDFAAAKARRAPSSTTRAAAIRAAFTPRTWRTRASSPRNSTWCACWSTCPHLRQWRRLRQRAQLHAQHGLRHLAQNSITDNLNYKHFLNITHLVTTIPEDRPSEEELFGAHWKKYGR